MAGQDDPRCSFCARSRAEVRRFITGQAGHICSDCVQVCTAALAREESEPERSAGAVHEIDTVQEASDIGSGYLVTDNG